MGRLSAGFLAVSGVGRLSAAFLTRSERTAPGVSCRVLFGAFREGLFGSPTTISSDSVSGVTTIASPFNAEGPPFSSSSDTSLEMEFAFLFDDFASVHGFCPDLAFQPTVSFPLPCGVRC